VQKAIGKHGGMETGFTPKSLQGRVSGKKGVIKDIKSADEKDLWGSRKKPGKKKGRERRETKKRGGSARNHGREGRSIETTKSFERDRSQRGGNGKVRNLKKETARKRHVEFCD